MVLVQIGYRLGPLHREQPSRLHRLRPQRRSPLPQTGNYGFIDQRNALE
jgi:hypothetical protein